MRQEMEREKRSLDEGRLVAVVPLRTPQDELYQSEGEREKLNLLFVREQLGKAANIS